MRRQIVGYPVPRPKVNQKNLVKPNFYRHLMEISSVTSIRFDQRHFLKQRASLLKVKICDASNIRGRNQSLVKHF